MDVDLRPAFLLAKRLAPGMRERGGEGGARLVGSCLYRRDRRPHYTASKAALIGLARSLAGP
jgi:NAD(P)-dependent dehydrogenase (short-subunit alcohol dehydrogenase family)